MAEKDSHDEESLASLATPISATASISRAKAKARAANQARARASGSSSAEEGPNRRPRTGDSELLRDVIMGFVEEAEDPVQQGDCADRESKEIAGLVRDAGDKAWEEIPIGKQFRHHYIWVAKGITHGSVRDRRRYTFNEHTMLQISNFEVLEDNTCDVCGITAKEELYEFRCYPRRRAGSSTTDRSLHPFISYISKKCGKGLLGLQSESSKLVEQLTTIVKKADVHALRELIRNSTALQRKVIEEKLRILAKTERGESEREAEIRYAEKVFGPLTKSSIDPFRACPRYLRGEKGLAFLPRDLVGLTVTAARKANTLPDSGFLVEVASRWDERLPIPPAPARWSKEDIAKTINALTLAVPIRILLKDNLRDEPIVFQRLGSENVPEIQLIYLPGCAELHALEGTPEIDNDSWSKVRASVKAALDDIRKDHQLLEKMIAGRKAPTRSRDVEEPPGGLDKPISYDFVTKALCEFNWPDCFSRANVRPEGSLFISAFPMGAVHNYCKGLMCSRTLASWPVLGKLINTWARQHIPEKDFKYTTIQFNKNYGAKMHVDGNNHGWSYIIGLGDYTGGGLWQYDEKGTDTMEVKETMRGYPHLKVGDKAPGKVVSIKNQWVKFDGNAPHAVKPFEGTRISIVFFTRQKWLNMKDEYRHKLEEHGFPIPGEDYMECCTDKANQAGGGSAAKRPKIDESDEIDEEEQLDQALQQDEDGNTTLWRAKPWGDRFQRFLGTNWGELSVGTKPIRVITSCVGPAPMLALQDLLPPGSVKLIAAAEEGNVGMMLVKQNCAPEYAFAKLEHAVDGKGFCEVRHGEVDADLSGTDLYVGTFELAPFLNRDYRRYKVSAFDDPKASPFRRHWQYISKYNPAAAILFATDVEVLDAKQLTCVFEFILEGVNPQDDSKWGLRHLGYGLEYTELSSSDFGVPVASKCIIFALAHERAGGQKAAENVICIVRALNGVLPRVTLQELLFNDSDPRFTSVQKKEWPRESRANEGGNQVVKRLVQEARNCGIRDGTNPYQDYMWLEQGSGNWNSWFPQGSPYQKRALDLVFVLAKRSGMEVANVVHDFSTDIRERTWSDDGLLRGSGPHYLFGRHRLLLGLEALLCVGAPIWRLLLKNIKDKELLCMLGTVPVPVCGAAIAGVLATVNFCGDRKMNIPKEKLQELLKTMNGVIDPFKEKLKNGAQGKPSAADEDAHFEGRAATMLSLVSHAKFVENSRSAQPPSKETKQVLASLAEVAKEVEGEFPEIIKDEPLNQATTGEWAIRDWSVRHRKLTVAKQKPPINFALEWVLEAAQETGQGLSRQIISTGLAMIKDELTKNAGADAKFVPIPELIRNSREELITLLKRSGLEFFAQAFLDFVDENVSNQGFGERMPGKAIERALQDYGSMKDYIDNVVRPLRSWNMQWPFLEHLARTQKSGEAAIHQFGVADGFDIVRTFLDEAPEDWDAKLSPKILGFYFQIKELRPSAYSLAEKKHSQENFVGLLRIMGEKAIEKVTEEINKHLNEELPDITEGIFRDLDSERSPLGKRFQTTQRIFEHVQSVVHSAEGQDMSSAEAANKLNKLKQTQASLETYREQMRQCQVAEFPGMQWNDIKLVMAEDAYIKDKETSLNEIFSKAVKRETQQRMRQQERLAEMAKREAERQAEEKNKEAARQEQLAKQQHEKDRNTAEGLARQVMALVDFASKRLRSPDANKFRSTILDLRTNPAFVVMEKETGPVKEAMEIAEIAHDYYGEEPERIALAKDWLHREQLSHIIEPLQENGLLARLKDIKSSGVLPDLLLPPRCSDVLLQKLLDLSDATLTPSKELLKHRGGHVKRSNTYGLNYFGQGNDRTWQWPPSLTTRISRPHLLQEPKAYGGQGSSLEQSEREARYVRRDKAGQYHCLICGGGCGPKHFRSEEHVRLRDAWTSLTATLETCTEALRSMPASEKTYLGIMWVKEMLQNIKAAQPKLSVPASSWGHLVSVFWHDIVRKAIPATGETAVASTVALHAKVEEMLSTARLGEPLLSDNVPKAGIDFPYYPPQTAATRSIDEKTDETIVDVLTATDLLGEGIRWERGTWHCGYCEVDFTDVRKHILPYYNEGKRHKNYLEVSVTAINDLKEKGWTLTGEGITIGKKKCYCEVCGNSDKKIDWYSIFGEGGHLNSKNHKHKRANVTIEKASDADKDAWAKMFREADENLSKLVLEERPKPQAPSQASSPPKRATLAVPKAVATLPPKKSRAIPPLPSSPQDFPGFLTKEADALNIADTVSDEQVARLSPTELAKEGLEARSYGFWCYYCENELTQGMLVAHLRSYTREGKHHKRCRGYAIQVAGRLGKDGPDLIRNGITIEKYKYTCQACVKNGNWYECFMHLETKKHQKCVHYLEDKVKDPPTEAERDAWAKLVGSPATLSNKRELTPDGSSAPSDLKRQAIEQTAATALGARENLEKASCPSAAPGKPVPGKPSSPLAALSVASGAVRVQVPSGLEWVKDHPTDAELVSLADLAKRKWYPDMVKPLHWGQDLKKNGMCIYCTACRGTVGWAKVNQQTPAESRIDPDGHCPHYTNQAKQNILAKMTACSW